MAYADRIKDVIAAAGGGTGTITLSGSPAATYRALSNIGATGTTFDYVMEDGTNWEIGVGTTGATANTFTRAVALSSNANAAVNFAAGANFFITAAAASLAAFVTTTSTATLTNKRLTKRSATVAFATSASPTYNTDNIDKLIFTGIAGTIVSMSTNLTGTPVEGDEFVIDFISTTGGSNATINWGTAFESSSIVLPATLPATVGQKLSVYLDWNATTSKRRCVGYA